MVAESEDFSGLGAGGEVRRGRLGSDNKQDQINRALVRMRPLLVLMRLVDSIKQRWDGKRLGLLGASGLKHDDYLRRLVDEFLAKDNLSEVITECDDIIRDYKDRILHLSSVEEFLSDMGMMARISETQQSLEQFIMAHF